MNAFIDAIGRHWPALKKWVLGIFLIVIVAVIVRQARTIAWHDVAQSLREYHATTLLQAGLLAAVAYAFYACFDLIGVRYVHARVPVARTMGIAFVAYAANQNFGALLGTVGMRLRLYGKQGLSQIAISKMIGLAVITNWLGYLLVAGTLFSAGMVLMPDNWHVSNDSLRLAGVMMLTVVIGYIALCRFSTTRALSIRGEKLVLPNAWLALAQVSVASLHWFAIASILYLLLRGQIGYMLVLGTYLLTSVSVVLARIPGGLGVIEAVFIAVLGSLLPVPQLMAALLAFRGIFFLGALLLAGAVYLLLEKYSDRNTSQLGARPL